MINLKLARVYFAVAFACYANNAPATVPPSAIIYSSGAVGGLPTLNVSAVSDQVVSNAFTLDTVATIRGFLFGGWTNWQDTIVSVQFGIGSGTSTTTAADLLAGPLLKRAFETQELREYAAQISPITLSPGTYYFTLGGALTRKGQAAAQMDAIDGPPTMVVDGESYPSRAAFSLTSVPATPLPEMSTWAMIIGGLGFVGASLRRRKVAVSFG